MYSCYFYTNIKTGEEFTLPQLQDKYNLGFAQKELWDIVEREYETVLKDITHSDGVTTVVKHDNESVVKEQCEKVYAITKTITDPSEYNHPVSSIYKIVKPMDGETLVECELRLKDLCTSLTEIGELRREEYSFDVYAVEVDV